MRKTTNCKEVKTRVREHILDFMTIEDLTDNVTHLMKINRRECPTIYHTIKYMVGGGSFYCYYSQVNNFIKSLQLNSKKEYSDNETWSLYCHLLARDGVLLVEHFKKNNDR